MKIWRTRTYKLFRETKTKVLNVSASLVLVAMSLGGSLPTMLSQKAFAAGTSSTATPTAPNGWMAQDGSPTYVGGPTGADGAGSLELTTTTEQKQNYFHVTNTPLADATNLGYKLHVSAGVPASYQLQVNGVTRIGSSSTFTSLVWEPVYNGQPNGPNSGFVSESNLEKGVWWSSHPINGDPAGNNGFVHLSDIIAANPRAVISAYGVNVGSGTPNATSYVDDVSFGSDITNFETNPPAAPTDLYFTRTNSASNLACGAAVNSSAGVTLHWAAPTDSLNQYAIMPSYPDGHGQYTYYPAGSATSVWIGDNFGHHGEGTYGYTIKAQNTSGQWSTTATCSIVYDTTAPVVTVTPAAGSTLSGIETFNITVADNNPLPTTTGWVYLYNTVDNANGNYSHQIGQNVTLTNGHGTFTVDTTTSKTPDGHYNLDVYKLADAAGNVSGASDTYFKDYTIDNTAPSVPALLTPVNRGYTKTNDFTFDWADSTDANNGVTYEFQSSLSSHTTNGVLDTGVWNSLAKGQTLASSQIHSTGAPNGTWHWQVRAIDAAGNKSAWTSVWHVTLDSNAPAGSIISPANNGYVSTLGTGGVLTVNGSASDNLGLNRVLVQLLTNKHSSLKNNTVYLLGTSEDWQSEFNVKGLGLSDGDYSLVATVVDNAGNTLKTNYTNFTLDNTKPTIVVDGAAPASYYGSSDPLNFFVNDANLTHTYFYQGSTLVKDYTNYQYFGASWLPAGTYQVYSVDAAGNESVHYTFTFDKTPPNLTVTNPSSDTIRNVASGYTVEGTASDDLSGMSRVALQINDTTNGISTSVNNLKTHTFSEGYWSIAVPAGTLTDGHTYQFNFNAYDNAGNHTTVRRQVTVDNTSPTIQGLSLNHTPTKDTSVTVSGTISDPNLTEYRYQLVDTNHNPLAGSLGWSHQGGTSSKTNQALFTADVSGLNDGNYFVRIWATDAAGNKTGIQTHIYLPFTIDRTGPAVSITNPLSGSVVSGLKDLTVSGTVDTSDISGVNRVIVYVKDLTTGTQSATLQAAVTSGTWTVNLDSSLLPNGHQLRVVAYAKDGLKNTGATAHADITSDGVAPTVTIDPYSGANTTPTLTGTIDDPTAGIMVAIDGNTAMLATNNGDDTWSFKVPSTLNTGKHSVVVTAADVATNSYQATADITVAEVGGFGAGSNALGAGSNGTAGGSSEGSGGASTVTVTPNNDGQVLGDSTNTASTASPDGKVKGDKTVHIATSADKHSENKFLGLGWWWLLILAVLVLAWWLFAAYRRSEKE